MTEKHDMTAPKMTRVTVRVPRTTLDQINDWVDTLGVRRSHFLGIALVAGVRSLMQASALEMSLAARDPSQSGTRPSAEGPTQRGAVAPDPADLTALAQMIQTLQSEVSSVQSEVTDLKDHLQAQRTSGRKRP
jgi:hypothetical protein